MDFLRSGIRKRATARRDITVAFPRGVGDGGASNAVTDFFLRNQTRPDAPLSATDWQAAICHVYQGSAADAQTVSVLVRKDISNRRPRDLVGHKQQQHRCLVMGDGEGLWSSSLPFGVFLQTLLGYQLDIHLRSLEQLREDFRKVRYGTQTSIGEVTTGADKFCSNFLRLRDDGGLFPKLPGLPHDL